MTGCDKCRARAVIYQKYSGMHLCPAHFEDDVRRKIRESIRETGVFARPARVAVALDGGKNSSAMLCALKALFSKRRDVELIAVMIDEGIEGYRPQRLVAARALADGLEIPCVIKSLKDAVGLTIDEVASRDARDHAHDPCRVCKALRDILLNGAARELEADALATGHSLDDCARAILQSYLSGDIDGLLKQIRQNTGEVFRIKPLRRVPESEIALYAALQGIHPIVGGVCPYKGEAMAAEVKDVLDGFDDRHPGTKYSLLRSFDRIPIQ